MTKSPLYAKCCHRPKKREALEDAAIHEHPIENTDFEDVSDDVESNENADDTEGTTEE